MSYTNNERANIDIFNYLSIDALEKIGITEPTEKQILLMEKLLRDSVAKEFKFYKYKGLQVIA